MIMLQIFDSLPVGDVAVLISAAAVVGVYLLKTHNRRQSLRIALLTELEEPGDVLENIEETPILPDEDFIPTQIYTSSADSLGNLSEREVKKIVEYYSLAFRLKNWINDPNYEVTMPEWYYNKLLEESKGEFQMKGLRDRVHSADELDPAVKRARHMNAVRKEAISEIEGREIL